MRIDIRVSNLINKYHTRDPYTLCNVLGIKVFKYHLPDNIKGFVHKIKRKTVIILNDSMSEHEERITLAHELGHAYLHKKLNYFFLKEHTLYPLGKYEVQANTFCAELLIPTEIFQENTDLCTHQIASLLNVTQDLIAYKLKSSILKK